MFRQYTEEQFRESYRQAYGEEPTKDVSNIFFDILGLTERFYNKGYQDGQKALREDKEELIALMNDVFDADFYLKSGELWNKRRVVNKEFCESLNNGKNPHAVQHDGF